MVPRFRLMLSLGLALMLMSCGGDLSRSDPGRLQPQTVSGPCDVKKFFLVALTTIHTDMTVASGAGACTMTLINPNLQVFNTAALVTTLPLHGQATAGLVLSGTQVAVSYTPQPGYSGTDSFAITIEPADRGVTFAVTVGPH